MYQQNGYIKPALILIFLGILFLSAAAGVWIKNKISTHPVYTPTSPVNYVTPPSITQLFQNEQIQLKPTPTKALLPGAKWVPQTFNNCGPATTSMVLQYFGHQVDQNETKKFLRTNSDDKNVFAYEIQEYLKSQYNIESKLLFNGDRETLKKLIANGFYVIIEDWLKPNEDIGHVTIIRGYDDDQGVFIADDSYLGVNIIYKYDQFDQSQWKPFNREYIPVYKKENEEILKAIIGENWDPQIMYQNAVKTAEQEISQNQNDAYAWFNLGTSYFGLKEYAKAKTAFERSRSIGWPKRMLWYQIQPVQTYNELGEYQKALELTRVGLWANDSFAELHYEAARAYLGLNDLPKAKEEIQKALYYAPNYQPAKDLSNSI